ncbi:1-aminocyclopropane-1-carboxylate deaminase [Shewanella mangrovi]|uniref:1-aminocyclopropane-1-carboxylate deaminase n=1 Tax=Shewanella mangrovi TaxID=1515746 RepID=A0A094J9V8_9GAMM|nr:pyridoxal-phosphate dependent enzyme [Shewanella mangrovi]KFZ36710.1 1-aminocyclopropane-1-carboxylate deaminase [Shewanella mangrovi]
MQLANSPVEQITLGKHTIFIKRDDLLHPQFSGNKARKFLYFLEHAFDGVEKVLGYGSAQANSLYSLAALCQLKGWQLDFYVDHLPQMLMQSPSGNYAAACAMGANVIVAPVRGGVQIESYLRSLAAHDEHCLLIAEGGRVAEAEYGVSKLAEEIAVWCKQHLIDELALFLPAGTGTTALFLAKYFTQHRLNIHVYTCPVVGDAEYLQQQFTQLCADTSLHPMIVAPPKKYHFGKCYLEFLTLWQQLNHTGITFELLYDPLGWMMLLQVAEQITMPMMYLHQGGVLGNQSILPRYQRKYPQCF